MIQTFHLTSTTKLKLTQTYKHRVLFKESNYFKWQRDRDFDQIFVISKRYNQHQAKKSMNERKLKKRYYEEAADVGPVLEIKK